MVQHISVKADRPQETNPKDTCLGAFYLKRWSVITKLCKFLFFLTQENVFMIATNNWIISLTTLFSTAVQCNNIFTSTQPLWKH
jgi:hypothetical protein